MISFHVVFTGKTVPFCDRRDPEAAARCAGVLAVALAAVVLRFTGLEWGFPALVNGDEPHLVNVAVSFGRGSLNPGVFKYPTLWMYALFAAFGGFFLVWSGLGLRRGVEQFGHLFVWEPHRFFLVGRVLSALSSLGALERVLAAGKALGERRVGLWAAALLAVSLKVVESAHAAKPDSLMLLWSAACWAAALAYVQWGEKRALLAAAALAGLAVSTQYTAAPVAAAPAAAFLARRLGLKAGERPSWLLGAAAAALIPAAFLAGSPYTLLDLAAFRRDMADHASLEFAAAPAGLKVLLNAASFGGPVWLCAPLLLAGAADLLRRDRVLAAVLGLPVLAHLAVLMPSDKGAVFRYLGASLPALALTAGVGVEALGRLAGLSLGRPAALAGALAVLMLPGGVPTARWALSLRLPDTRNLAAAWFEANVPPGTKVLIGAETDNPPLRMSKAQAERLHARTAAAGHARARYYRLMADSHPGGGWEVLTMSRDAHEMDTAPWHRAWSESGRDALDVREGLAAAQAADVEVAVLSSQGLGLGVPSVERFLREAEERGTLLAVFAPAPGASAGPTLRVFRLPRNGSPPK